MTHSTINSYTLRTSFRSGQIWDSEDTFCLTRIYIRAGEEITTPREYSEGTLFRLTVKNININAYAKGYRECKFKVFHSQDNKVIKFGFDNFRTADNGRKYELQINDSVCVEVMSIENIV